MGNLGGFFHLETRMEENANPTGSENPAPINVEAAFEDYLNRQANPASNEPEEVQPGTEAEEGQSEDEAKPEPEQEAEPEEQRFKVKVNGEEREIPLSELVKGYQLESDYRIKTSQVAEQARAAQAQYQQAQALQAHYAEALNTYSQQLQSMQPRQPDASLIESNPIDYLRQQQAYQNWQQQMQQVRYEQQVLEADQQQRQQSELAELAKSSMEYLAKEIPGWASGNSVDKGILEYARSAGLVTEGLGPAIARMPAIGVLMHKAMQYDQMTKKQASVTEKVAKLPPKAPVRPGGGEISPTDGRTRAIQSLK